jgi:ATP-dependent exoDNAse (exonuclease V) alpha subunit
MSHLSEEQKHNFNKILQFNEGALIVFGSAGTGKSRLLKAVQDADDHVVTLGPTGISALNVRGVTIHSFFGIKPSGATFKMKYHNVKALKNASKILIDECSMVSSMLLEQINEIMQNTLKNNSPFGGKPIVFFGDLAQIEPVVKDEEKHFINQNYGSHFFFDSPTLQLVPIEIIQLHTIYRQQGDISFIEALQSIRKGNSSLLNIFNERIDLPHDDAMRITYTNRRSSEINVLKLSALTGQQYVSTAKTTGEFTESDYPTDEKVYFKLNARVMLLVNDKEAGYVNGDTGEIIDIQQGNILVKLDRENKFVNVKKYTWEKVSFDGVDGAIVENVTGTFEQVPFKLAYASSTHKIQGKTITGKVHLELETKTFAHGLLYVALSRATKLEDLTIGRRIYSEDLIIHPRVKEWCLKNCI